MNVAAATRAIFIPDTQGSVIASLDSGSGALSKIGYLPYGKSASATAPFGYTGQRIDPETNGLYYFRTRHYSPLLGRFLQTDPTGTNGGVNLYVYAANDPLNHTDPTGMAPDLPPPQANLPTSYYPPNNGFAGTPQYVVLPVGTALGRYGFEGGTFLAPAGTPAQSLSLPYGSESLPYNEYTVVTPLLVLSGQAAPAFGQFGGGTQYLPFGGSVRNLIDTGFLQ